MSWTTKAKCFQGIECHVVCQAARYRLRVAEGRGDEESPPPEPPQRQPDVPDTSSPCDVPEAQAELQPAEVKVEPAADGGKAQSHGRWPASGDDDGLTPETPAPLPATDGAAAGTNPPTPSAAQVSEATTVASAEAAQQAEAQRGALRALPPPCALPGLPFNAASPPQRGHHSPRRRPPSRSSDLLAKAIATAAASVASPQAGPVVRFQDRLPDGAPNAAATASGRSSPGADSSIGGTAEGEPAIGKAELAAATAAAEENGVTLEVPALP